LESLYETSLNKRSKDKADKIQVPVVDAGVEMKISSKALIRKALWQS